MRNGVPGLSPEQMHYWRDIGTLPQFYTANMDVLGQHPRLNIFNREWHVLTHNEPNPPARFRDCKSLESIIESGALIEGANISHSTLSYGVVVLPGTNIQGSILMGYNNIGRNV